MLQGRTYFADYMKNHNALIMQDIFDLRTSIMRRNAQLVDWLTDHLGPVKLQMIHKKPCPVPHTSPVTSFGPGLCVRDYGVPVYAGHFFIF